MILDPSSVLAALYPPGAARRPLPPHWREVALLLRRADGYETAAERLCAAGFPGESLRLAASYRRADVASDPRLRSAFDAPLERLWGRVRAQDGGAVPSAFVSGALPRGGFLYAGIGCRRPDPRAAGFARDAASLLAPGALLVSGGARGCDAAFAAGAASAGGFALAILPSGLDAPLGVLDGYAARLSPFALGETFTALGAMRRNALVAAAASLVLVASARRGEGGSWHAAVGALRARRRVAAYVGPGAGEGAAALISLGAVPLRDAREAADLARLAAALPVWEDLGAVWREQGGLDARLQPHLAVAA